MSISDGQPVNASASNAAWVSKTANDTKTGTLTLNHPTSGGTVSNTQMAINDLITDVGTVETQVNSLITDVTNLQTLTGMPDGSVDLGTFTGSTIPDSSDIKDALQSLETEVELKEDVANKGVAGGYASLDGGGKVPVSQLPSSIMEYQGTWNASTNTPTLADGVGDPGDVYIVSVAGTQDLGSGNITFAAGDWVIYNGSTWEKSVNSNAVASVNGFTGAVVLSLDDIDDVDEASPALRDFLQYNGTDWTGVQRDSSANDSATGSNATLSSVTTSVVRLTNASLVSVDMVPAGFSAQRFVLENKTTVAIDINNDTGATAADRILTGTGNSLTLEPDASLFLIYDSTSSRWMIVGGTGSGGGSNFDSLIQGEDSTFEGGVGTWTLYNDSSEIPVDGTGGTTTGLTFTENTSTPINGESSGRLSKDAANRQGGGVALPLTVSDKFKNKPCKIQIFTRGSANFDFGSDESVDPGDVMFYLYDVTNAQLIYMSPRNMDGSGIYEGVVNMSSASSVRVLAHIRSTNALAWDLDIDDVKLEVVTNQFLNNMSDWTPYPSDPVTQGFGTPTFEYAYYRQNGSNLEILYRFVAGTVSAVEARFGLPPGYITLSNLDADGLVLGPIGRSELTTSTIYHLAKPNLTYLLVSNHNIAGGATTSTTGNNSANTGNTLSGHFSVPIQGLTSGALTPQQIGQNFPAFFAAKKSGDQAVTNGVTTKITFDSIQNDNLGGWDSTNNRYVAKVAGHYIVSGSLFSAASAQSAVVRVYKNGSEIYSNFNRVDSANQANPCLCTPPIQMNVGDYFELFGTINAGSVFGSSFFTFFGVTKVDSINSQPGLNKIAYLKEEQTSGTNAGTFTSGAWQTRTLNTKSDPYGIVSLGSNKFTLQPGTYKISASAPAYNVALHKAKLRNITSGSDLIIGSNAYCSNTDNVQTDSLIKGSFSISAATTYEIQHRCSTTKATDGFGTALSFSVVEVYTQVEIEKIA